MADAKTEVDAEAEARAEAEAETEVEADVLPPPFFFFLNFWRQRKESKAERETEEGRRIQDQDPSHRRWFWMSELTEVRNLGSFEEVRTSFRREKKTKLEQGQVCG